MKTDRIVSLDIAKAICIILVVVGHYIPDNSPEWYKLIHDVIYTFHMPLFMFASGYVYIATKKDIGYGDFIVKKIKKIDGAIFNDICHSDKHKDVDPRKHECG